MPYRALTNTLSINSNTFLINICRYLILDIQYYMLNNVSSIVVATLVYLFVFLSHVFEVLSDNLCLCIFFGAFYNLSELCVVFYVLDNVLGLCIVF